MTDKEKESVINNRQVESYYETHEVGYGVLDGCVNDSKPYVYIEALDSDTFEKTDPYNGFMLSPTFDFLFDRGFMSFTDDKKVMLSPFLSKMTYSKIGISDNKNIPMLPVEGREEYLKYHRENIFKSGGDI